jgi:hypothetical protein
MYTPTPNGAGPAGRLDPSGPRPLPGDPLWRLAKKVREWKKKYDETTETARRLRDPDTRVQEIVKLVRKWLPTLIKKVCGKAPPIDNPYYDNLLDCFEEAVDAYMGIESGRRDLVRADKLVGKVNETAINVLKDYGPDGPQGRRLKRLLDEIRFLKAEERYAAAHNGGLVREWWISPRLRAAEVEIDELAAGLRDRVMVVQLAADGVDGLVGEYRKKLEEVRAKEGKFKLLYKAFGSMEGYYTDALGTVSGDLSNGTSRDSSPEQRARYAAKQARRRELQILDEIERAISDGGPPLPPPPLPEAPPAPPKDPAPAPPAAPAPAPPAPEPAPAPYRPLM